MSRSCLIALTLAVVVLAGTRSLARASVPLVQSCGDYQVIGALHFDEKGCWLTVMGESRSEFRLGLRQCPSVYVNYNGATIQTRIRIEAVDPLPSGKPLEKVPLRSLPNPTANALKLIHSATCGSVRKP